MGRKSRKQEIGVEWQKPSDVREQTAAFTKAHDPIADASETLGVFLSFKLTCLLGR
jgi:hypothetical protein